MAPKISRISVLFAIYYIRIRIHISAFYLKTIRPIPISTHTITINSNHIMLPGIVPGNPSFAVVVRVIQIQNVRIWTREKLLTQRRWWGWIAQFVYQQWYIKYFSSICFISYFHACFSIIYAGDRIQAAIRRELIYKFDNLLQEGFVYMIAYNCSNYPKEEGQSFGVKKIPATLPKKIIKIEKE